MTGKDAEDGTRRPVLGHQCPFCGSWLPKDGQVIERHLMTTCEPLPGSYRAAKRVNK